MNKLSIEPGSILSNPVRLDREFSLILRLPPREVRPCRPVRLEIAQLLAIVIPAPMEVKFPKLVRSVKKSLYLIIRLPPIEVKLFNPVRFVK